jgi:glyoxylase-like metal-dependent hydrolase (beta-lactamase superfamily II)
MPAHLEQLRGLLAELGRCLADVRAVLLTRGHLDHTGLAHTAQEAGADIWVQQQDAAILHDGPRSGSRHSKPERSMLPYLLRRPSTLILPLQMARAGAFSCPAVQNTRGFETDRVLEEVPGAPQAVTLPGHTPGSAAYLFADRGLLFTGDALVTEDQFAGRTGPTLVRRCFTHDSKAALAALDRIDELTADLLLPGHGAPFADGLKAATKQARDFGAH